MKNPFKGFSVFEIVLFSLSAVTVTAAGLLCRPINALNIITSLIGITALIFVSKGRVVGQVITVIFAALYGVVSFFFRYYGEMITYLGMTAPIAVLAVISWARHPDAASAAVKVGSVSGRQLTVMSVLTAAVTAGLGYVLYLMGTANLAVSIVSVATSFVASYLTFLRSPYYALGYALNDVILIVLWTLAAVETTSYAPMVACFAAFLANDIYGFVNWRRLKKLQTNGDCE